MVAKSSDMRDYVFLLEEIKYTHRNLIGKSERRTRRRYEDNIKMNLIDCEYVDLIHLDQNKADVYMLMKHVSLGVRNLLTL